MEEHDARCMTPEPQEDLRNRVNAAVRQGMSQAEAARIFEVSRQSVNGWISRCREGGLRRLRSAPRGRPRIFRLAPHQAATAVRLITDRCPDQLKLPFALWTREAVAQLLLQRFGLAVSVWTAGRYLANWGFSPQKPVRCAYERNPEAVKRWIREEHPAIRYRDKREGAQIQ